LTPLQVAADKQRMQVVKLLRNPPTPLALRHPPPPPKQQQQQQVLYVQQQQEQQQPRAYMEPITPGRALSTDSLLPSGTHM